MGVPPDQTRIQEFISECLKYERPPVFIPGLSPTHNIIVAMLLRDGDDEPAIVPRAALLKFIGDQTTMNVTMCHLRQKLPLGVKVHNIHGVGFYMSKSDAEKLRKAYSR